MGLFLKIFRLSFFLYKNPKDCHINIFVQPFSVEGVHLCFLRDPDMEDASRLMIESLAQVSKHIINAVQLLTEGAENKAEVLLFFFLGSVRPKLP